jgi:hypothetical protein
MTAPSSEISPMFALDAADVNAKVWGSSGLTIKQMGKSGN